MNSMRLRRQQLHRAERVAHRDQHQRHGVEGEAQAPEQPHRQRPHRRPATAPARASWCARPARWRHRRRGARGSAGSAPGAARAAAPATSQPADARRGRDRPERQRSADADGVAGQHGRRLLEQRAHMVGALGVAGLWIGRPRAASAASSALQASGRRLRGRAASSGSPPAPPACATDAQARAAPRPHGPSRSRPTGPSRARSACWACPAAGRPARRPGASTGPAIFERRGAALVRRGRCRRRRRSSLGRMMSGTCRRLGAARARGSGPASSAARRCRRS